jgi:hypothetical protein
MDDRATVGDWIKALLLAFLLGALAVGVIQSCSGFTYLDAHKKAAIDAARGTMWYEAKLVEQPDGTTKWVVTEREQKGASDGR